MTMDPGKLRDRLRGIVTPARSSSTPNPAATPTAVDTGAVRSAVCTTPGIETVLGGEWRSGACGRSFVVTRKFAADEPYGHQSVGAFAERLRTAGGEAALLAAGTPRVPFVFFDLETTGLSGGAGTHAFLVGCGWFDDEGAFVVEQHLMVDFAAERGMLSLVHDVLSRAGAMVTFNGKSFDAPVIETRYLFHRLSSPCAQLPHLDVLHPARRFWGGHNDEGCSLITLERHLLGARRVGDVPGFEIPARYFQYVRSGDAAPLADVLQHNRLDLLSLAGLTARLLTMLDEGPSAAGDAREALALARIYERNDDHARARNGFERAALLAETAIRRQPGRPRPGAPLPGSAELIRVEALRALALNARRARQFEEAAACWRQVMELAACPAHVRREAAEALAIHHEHRVRDLETAKMFALKSLESGSEAAWGDAVRHRLARIERKMVSERSLLPSLPLPLSCGSPTSERRTSS
jgi:uncharacterized protein YprB with RNaseH-like and TPR domain